MAGGPTITRLAYCRRNAKHFSDSESFSRTSASHFRSERRCITLKTMRLGDWTRQFQWSRVEFKSITIPKCHALSPLGRLLNDQHKPAGRLTFLGLLCRTGLLRSLV